MSAYSELKAVVEKMSDDDLLAEMDKHALALTVLWRDAKRREEASMLRDRRYLKKLFVQVYLSDRRGVHISAIRGLQLR